MLSEINKTKNELRARGDTRLLKRFEIDLDKVVILTTDNSLNCIKIRQQKYNTNAIF